MGCNEYASMAYVLWRCFIAEIECSQSLISVDCSWGTLCLKMCRIFQKNVYFPEKYYEGQVASWAICQGISKTSWYKAKVQEIRSS